MLCYSMAACCDTESGSAVNAAAVRDSGAGLVFHRELEYPGRVWVFGGL
jgi:hypothetical protein